jgi:Kelch motif protein
MTSRRRLLGFVLAIGASAAGCASPSVAPSGAPGTARATPALPGSPATSATPSLPLVGGSWATGPEVPRPLGEVASAVVDGRLYVAGGFTDGRRQSDALLVFDPAAGTWTELTRLPEARDHAALTAIDGRLYLSGGNAEGLAPRANSGATTLAPTAGRPWPRCPRSAPPTPPSP